MNAEVGVSEELLVVNAGSGPVIAGERILYPGETRRLAQGAVDALNAVHGAGTLVAVGLTPAPTEDAPTEDAPVEPAPTEGAAGEPAPVVEAAASGRKGRK